MRATVILGLLAAGLAGCASFSPRATIEDRLVELGLSEARSECMARELDQRLNDRELSQFADFLTSLTEEDDQGLVRTIQQNADPTLGGAAAGAALACVLTG